MIKPHANIRYYGRQLKLNSEYKYYVRYWLDDGLLTEDGQPIATEDNNTLVVETQYDESNRRYYLKGIDSSKILGLKRNNLGELFRTYMKSYEFETRVNMAEDVKPSLFLSTVGYSGITNYGEYNIYSKKYNLAKDSYTYILVDDMIKTMNKLCEKSTMFDEENDSYVPTTIGKCIRNILTNCGFDTSNIYTQVSSPKIANHNFTLYPSYFDDKDIYGKISCRTMLDNLLQLTGCSIALENGYPVFKNHIVNLNKKDERGQDYYSSNDIPYSEIKNLDSNNFNWFEIQAIRIEAQDYMYTVGYDAWLNEYIINPTNIDAYVIKGNLITDNLEDYYRETIAKNLLNKLYVEPIEDGSTYNLDIGFYNLETTGIDYFEYMDCFYVGNYHGNPRYLLCLQDTTTVENGYEETFTSEKTDEFIHID